MLGALVRRLAAFGAQGGMAGGRQRWARHSGSATAMADLPARMLLPGFALPHRGSLCSERSTDIYPYWRQAKAAAGGSRWAADNGGRLGLGLAGYGRRQLSAWARTQLVGSLAQAAGAGDSSG